MLEVQVWKGCPATELQKAGKGQPEHDASGAVLLDYRLVAPLVAACFSGYKCAVWSTVSVLFGSLLHTTSVHDKAAGGLDVLAAAFPRNRHDRVSA